MSSSAIINYYTVPGGSQVRAAEYALRMKFAVSRQKIYGSWQDAVGNMP